MKRREFMGATVAAAGGLGLAKSLKADAPMRWKMVTGWPKNFPGLGTGAETLAEKIGELSDGQLQVQVYGAGELVPAFEVFDAVSQGAAQLGHSSAYYWKGKNPAFQFFSGVPFGMNVAEMNSWLRKGGGLELWEEAYAPFGVLPLIAGSTMVQMGGWFNKEINHIDDLQGLRMRIPGLGGEALRRAGGTPVNISGKELLVSLQTGAIDATEWVGPWNDLAFGLHRAAEYYYYPGWQEPNTIVECLVNREAFDSLPENLQSVVRAAALAANDDMICDYVAHNHDALDALINQHQVKLRAFPDAVLQTLRRHAEEVVQELAASDPLAQRIHESYSNFYAKVRRWTEVSEKAYLDARSRNESSS